MAAASPAVTVDELISLFTGVPVDTDNPAWSTTPTHSFLLAHEVARLTSPPSELALRRAFYADLPVDDIPTSAVEAIKLGYARYTITRGNRGL